MSNLTRSIVAIFFFPWAAISQTDSASRFVLIPPGLHVAPLRGNLEEPRIGVFKFLDAAQMKVDIGNSIDVFGYDIPASGVRFTAGIDFMAYAFTTGAQGLRLQIDAIDGFFGGNISFSKSLSDETLQVRLRVLHHSAHFVDGHYDAAAHSWIDNRDPLPFTRDFGEIVFAYLLQSERTTFRAYGGFGYATLIRPAGFRRFTYLAGGEIARNVGQLLGQDVNLYCVYNISLAGMPAYAASHQIQVGTKLGTFYGKGPSFYLAYYTGSHMFAEYAGDRLATIGAGFTVDFF